MSGLYPPSEGVRLKCMQSLQGGRERLERSRCSYRRAIGVVLFSALVAWVVIALPFSLSLLPSPQHQHAKFTLPKEWEIDAVYTWVNGSDPVWRRSLNLHRRDVETSNDTSDTVSDNRFRDLEELRYSLRSLETYAPWIRHVFLVTDNQVPSWLNTSHPRLSIVPHHVIFNNKSHLPTFSSPAIESNLHRIPGLSKRFIYFNDDVMLGLPVFPDDFITSNGQRVYLSWDVPNCATGCLSKWLGDGTCDKACNVTSCMFDLGDCANGTSLKGGGTGMYSRGGSAHGRSYSSYNHLQLPRCMSSCPTTLTLLGSWLGDRTCDTQCNDPLCGYDGFDCGIDAVRSGLPGFNVTSPLSSFRLLGPSDKAAIYFDLTPLQRQLSHVTYERIYYQSSHEDAVITTLVSQYFHHAMLILSKDAATCHGFHGDVTLQMLVEGRDANSSLPVSLSFNLTLPCPPPPPLEGNISSSSSETGGTRTMGRRLVQSLPLQKEDREMGQLMEALYNLDEEGIRVAFHSTLSGSGSTRLRRGRRLDTFGASLVHVNMLLTSLFGSEARKVPAHMPHMIDKEVMGDLIAAFPNEWEATSARRFRSSLDMQYSFSYFYYGVIYNRGRPSYTLEETFSLFVDTDHDGRLNPNEVRSLVALAKEGATSPAVIEAATRCLHGRPGACNGTACDMDHEDFITLESVRRCPDIVKGLAKNVKVRRFEKLGTEEVSFEMLDDNSNRTLDKLDKIRAKRTKFICINDNQKSPSPSQFRVIRDFFEAMWPLPSSFELRGTVNRHLRYDELLRHREGERPVVNYSGDIVKQGLVAIAGVTLVVSAWLMVIVRY